MASRFEELHPKPTYTATSSKSYKSYLFRLAIWQTEKSIWYEALKWVYEDGMCMGNLQDKLPECGAREMARKEISELENIT